MKPTRLALAVASFLVAGALSVPTAVHAYVTNGVVLGIGQRDFRVFNNFVEASANDNVTPHPNYPGALGAVLSIWKSAVEWDSLPHGDGTGDGTQPIVGSGGANMDHTYQGTATGAGVPGDNIVSGTGPGCGGACGGVTEYAPGGGANGWRIRINDPDLAWDDAPGAISGALYDIQSTSCHEFGHTVGLGHSTGTGCTRPTMVGGPAAGDTCRRSIEADDIAGVQAVYAVAAAAKPAITGLAGSTQIGATLTVLGTNFAATGNEVWFTKTSSDGIPSTVTGLASTGGGTQISVTIPANAADGDVLVKVAGMTGSTLSNAWPLDTSIGPPPVPTLTSVSPDPVPIYGWTIPTITLTGTNLGAVSSVSIGATVLSGAALTTSPTQISFLRPLLPSVGPYAVTATAPGGTSNAVTLTVDPVVPPFLDAPSVTATGLPFTATTWTVPGDLVILTFSASNLPSSLPGIVDLALGNGFTSLFFFPTLAADPAQGKATVGFAVAPGGAGLTFYFQAVSIPPSLATPWPTTNLVTAVILF